MMIVCDHWFIRIFKQHWKKCKNYKHNFPFVEQNNTSSKSQTHWRRAGERLNIILVCWLFLMPKSISIPHQPKKDTQTVKKSFQKYWQPSALSSIIKYSLRRATINYISSQNLGVRLCTVHACGMRKGNTAAAIAALNCRRRSSVKDSFDFESQSRLHHCETNIARDNSALLQIVGTHWCTGFFFVAQMPVTTEWPAGWDMILRQPLFSESKRNNATWDGGRDRKTTFRQTGGKQETVCDRKSVAYRSKQGNCIDSFRPNRL